MEQVKLYQLWTCSQSEPASALSQLANITSGADLSGLIDNDAGGWGKH